jgi:two-component system chemotaxis response regulator CheB
MTRFPLPVVMLSSLTAEGTVETVQALTIGAVDFIAKPEHKSNMTSILEEVGGKIIRASKAKIWPMKKLPPVEPLPTAVTATKRLRNLTRNDKIVVIGSSTGGPRALNTVVPNLPSDLPASFLVIQHMPVGFTRSLSERLNQSSQLLIKEAEPGDSLEVGRCLVAPGGFHMILDQNNTIALNQNPAVHGVRPAVDVTLISAAQKFGDRIVSVILTGMGNDGTNGAILVHSSGGWVIAESEETCVVWGMPRSVFEAGAANEVVPLHQVSQAIVNAVKG